MLQRIQSVYLLLAAVAMLVASATPLVVFFHNVAPIVFEAVGVFHNGQLDHFTWGLLAIGVVSSFLALITIFLFKKRTLQIRLSILNVVLMIGFYLYAGFIVYQHISVENFLFQRIGVGVVMPLIALVFTLLAIRGIRADEEMLRSLHRLRK